MARIAYLCTDLLFTSKIRETATALGHELVGARDAAGLLRAAEGASVAIVDLRRPDAMEALDGLGQRASSTEGVPISLVGFCDHERVDLFAEARRRGCTALAKGKFSQSLAELLPDAARG